MELSLALGWQWQLQPGVMPFQLTRTFPTADQPRFEHPAAERRLPVRRGPRRRGPRSHPPQVREPHLHVLSGHFLHRLPHSVVGGVAAVHGAALTWARRDAAGETPTLPGPLVPSPAPLTAANLVTVIASSYGRTCTSVCSWSRRNQNRVCLQPRG